MSGSPRPPGPPSPYTDMERPPLNARALRRALITPDGLWTRLDLSTETGSTNADAVVAAQAGEPEGLIVVAERQSAGRGRHGRTWQSPPRAGIAVSVLLRPGGAEPDRGWSAVPPTAYGWLPLLAGVALAEAVVRLAELNRPPAGAAERSPRSSGRSVEVDGPPAGAAERSPRSSGLGPGLDAVLKWPNDLLVGGAKCGGILAEAVPSNDLEQPPAVVVGVGVNVTLRADELPVNPNGLPATSLQLVGAENIDRDPLLRALLRGMESWYGRWRAAGGDAQACGLREAYLRWCATVGREVRVLLPAGNELIGVASGVDPDGRLVVRDAAGDHTVAGGDVLHLR